MKEGATVETKLLRYARQLEHIVELKLASALDTPDELKPIDIRYLLESLDKLFTLRRRLEDTNPSNGRSLSLAESGEVDSDPELDGAGGRLPLGS
jgi:hypothetical protein